MESQWSRLVLGGLFLDKDDSFQHNICLFWFHSADLLCLALLTRVLENDVCNTSLAKMTPEKCRGFKVFQPAEMHAVNWDNWTYFIDPKYTSTVLDATAKSTVVHLLNHTWRNVTVTKSKFNRTAYEALAKKNCPKVYNVAGDHI